jgi:hypothetical protein
MDVLYEDGHLLIVSKPAGLVVHPTYKNKTGTLLDILLADPDRWPADARPSIVGRLDKLTSGIVVVAKTAAMHAAMQRAWASGDAEKDYLAVVYGRVSEPSGTIDLRLRHDPVDRRMMVVSNEGEASPVSENDGMSSDAVRWSVVDAPGPGCRSCAAVWSPPPASDPRTLRRAAGQSSATRMATAPVKIEKARSLHLAFPAPGTPRWPSPSRTDRTRARSIEAPVPRDLVDLMEVIGFSAALRAGLPHER